MRNKTNRAARRTPIDRQAQAKELTGAERKLTNTFNTVTRLIMGVEQPKKYLDATVALGALYSLPHVIDVFFGDLDQMTLHQHSENEPDKNVKTVSSDLFRLFQHVYQSEVSGFETTAETREEAVRWANEQSDLASTFVRFFRFIFCFSDAPCDRWRVNQLLTKMDELVSDGAQEAMVEKVRSRCLEHLENIGYKTLDEAKSGVERMKDDLEKIKEAKAKGMTREDKN